MAVGLGEKAGVPVGDSLGVAIGPGEGDGVVAADPQPDKRSAPASTKVNFWVSIQPSGYGNGQVEAVSSVAEVATSPVPLTISLVGSVPLAPVRNHLAQMLMPATILVIPCW